MPGDEFMAAWKEGAHPHHPRLERSVMCRECMLTHPIVVEALAQAEERGRVAGIEVLRELVHAISKVGDFDDETRVGAALIKAEALLSSEAK